MESAHKPLAHRVRAQLHGANANQRTAIPKIEQEINQRLLFCRDRNHARLLLEELVRLGARGLSSATGVITVDLNTAESRLVVNGALHF